MSIPPGSIRTTCSCGQLFFKTPGVRVDLCPYCRGYQSSKHLKIKDANKKAYQKLKDKKLAAADKEEPRAEKPSPGKD